MTRLLQEQQRLAALVGEPLFVTIHLLPDGFVDVDVETPTGRRALVGGDSLPEMLVVAVETLLYLDDVSAQLRP